MDQGQWESALKKELKTEQIERFLKRALPEGGEQSLLSRSNQSWLAPARESAALSFTFTQECDLNQKIAELLKLGVWDFIIDPFLLGWEQATIVTKLASIKESDARIWVIGPTQTHHPVIHATAVIASGGHAVHEMGLLLSQIIDWASAGNTTQIGVAVQCDREFFKSIAKLRAMKAVTLAALKELKKEDLFDFIMWVARSSWRDFTAFDAASNILRNATAVSAGLVGRADVVESLPYDLLIDSDAILSYRAERVGLTTQLVLQQEAGLGEVADAASGSFALEELTRTLGESAWTLMQQLQASSDKLGLLTPLIQTHWTKVQQQFNTRKIVQAGINDFPEATERVHLKKRFQNIDHRRLGMAFEQLRLKTQDLLAPPTVAIAVVGDYAALNARLSFTKNFFELLGLKVLEPGHGLKESEVVQWTKNTKCSVWAIVAADADHEALSMQVPITTRLYLAGKTVKSGMINLHAGMDVRLALEDLLLWAGAQ